MHVKLAVKFSSAIVGAIVLAISASAVTLFSARFVAGLVQDTVTENLSSFLAAEELEIALLEERGSVASFMIDDGNPEWLKDIQHWKQGFHDALDQARKTGHTPSEKRILDRLEEVYQECDEKRDEMIALYQGGDPSKGKALFLKDVNSLYCQTEHLCHEFIAENRRCIDATAIRVQDRIRRITWLVGGFVGLVIGLGVALLWLFFHRVFLPLRQMIADARAFAGSVPALAVDLPEDELRIADAYLHSLMSELTDTRSSLMQSRKQLMDTEKMAVVGKLATGRVAHEIRNPLTAIKMWLFSIRKGVGHTADLDRKFEIVSEEITRLENVVRNFLEFSRPLPLQLRALSVSRIIDNTLELLSCQLDEKGIRLVRDDAEGLPPIMADAEQLKQVFINLLDNAVDATPEGGEIQILADTASNPDDRQMVVVRVQDNGITIPHDVREQIFRPFYTMRPDGTGLGLCIAADIMARHNGRIVLESSTDRETSFAVWIPIAWKEADEQHPGS